MTSCNNVHAIPLSSVSPNSAREPATPAGATLKTHFKTTDPPGSPAFGHPPSLPGSPTLPVIENPVIDMADMTLALLLLQDSLAKQTFETGRIMADHHRREMEHRQAERVDKYNEWMEKLEEAKKKIQSAGFFGRLGMALKSFFKGDFEDAGKKLEEAFKENPVTGGLFSATAIPLLIGGGPLGLVSAAALFAPEIMNDPAVQKAMIESYAKTFNMSREDAGKAIAIFTTAVGALWAVASASSPVVRGTIVGAFQGEAAYKKYEADTAQADAQEKEAALDQVKADQEFIQSLAETHLELMKAIIESLSRNLRTTMEIIQLEAETAQKVNQAIGAAKRI